MSSSPARFHLVHFRSKHLAHELRARRFRHAFPAGSGFVIDQDGLDTFTAHYPLTSPDEDSSKLDPEEMVFRILGGRSGRWPVNIDQVLVHSKWQPSFAIAKQYISDKGNVLLAGDAAHFIPPHGGYGLNSGIVDAIDLAWRLAAIVKGYGGNLLLNAYSLERRPMMMRALRRSHRHLMEHVRFGEMYNRKENWNVLDSDSDEGQRIRASLQQFLDLSGPDTTDWGVELDLRYDYSPCICPDPSDTLAATVEWDVKRYEPSTKPGHRAPHVFLSDGETSTYDLFGREWTLIHFISESQDISKANNLLQAAEALKFPLKHVILQQEGHVRTLWERDLGLVRPDTHIAWRGNDGLTPTEAERVLAVVLGRIAFPGYTEPMHSEENLLRDIIAPLGVFHDD